MVPGNEVVARRKNSIGDMSSSKCALHIIDIVHIDETIIDRMNDVYPAADESEFVFHMQYIFFEIPEFVIARSHGAGQEIPERHMSEWLTPPFMRLHSRIDSPCEDDDGGDLVRIVSSEYVDDRAPE